MNREKIARAYLERGWSFYPTRPRSKVPFTELLPVFRSADGREKRGWTPYQSALPTPRDVETWFAIAPDCNLALVTGAVSHLVVIDLDDEAAVTGFLDLTGAQILADFKTPLVQSRRGFHLYFRRPDAQTLRGDLEIEGCDVKADGGCCTAPPSVHASGHAYKFLFSPARFDLQPLPNAVLERLTRPEPAPAIPTVIPTVQRDSGSAYGRATLRNALAELSATRENRNKALNRIAYRVGRVVATGALDYATAYAALSQTARAIGLDAREIGPTLVSGLGDGTQNPRLILDRAQRPIPARRAQKLQQLRGATL